MPRLGLLVACVLAIAGCGGSSDFELAPVSGVVTLDGQPVPYTHITFVPQGSAGNANPGPGSTAICDDTGKFQLKTVRGDDGAVVGKHSVQISSTGPPRPTSGDTDMGPPPKEAFPARFNVNSELTFEVPEDGSTTADFKLTTQP
jgi:hypothetical protein